MTTDPLLREAIRLGFTVTPGSNHWKLTHENGGRTVLSYNGGHKKKPKAQQDFLADLRRIVKGQFAPPRTQKPPKPTKVKSRKGS
jgi:hypothetical protein